jgi:hypothetical protein
MVSSDAKGRATANGAPLVSKPTGLDSHQTRKEDPPCCQHLKITLTGLSGFGSPLSLS